MEKSKKGFFGRAHPGLNQGPLELQSNALPLSYIPVFLRSIEPCKNFLYQIIYFTKKSTNSDHSKTWLFSILHNGFTTYHVYKLNQNVIIMGFLCLLKHWWFNGRILACHVGDRGSIPRQCRLKYARVKSHYQKLKYRMKRFKYKDS